MAVNKPRINVTNSVSIVITTLAFYGVLPYSMLAYYRHKILRTSIIGNIYLILVTINYSVQYHFETFENYVGKNNRDTGLYYLKFAFVEILTYISCQNFISRPSMYQPLIAEITAKLFNAGTLTVLISMVIMYMEPSLMIVDAIAFFINQRKIIDLINLMEKVNEKLIRRNINVNLGRVRTLSIVLISTISILEIGLVTYNYVRFKDAIWFFPIYLSGLAKVLYVSLVYITQQFFNGINNQLEATQIFFDENKLVKKQKQKNKVDTDEFGYLHKEILTKRKVASKRKVVLSGDVEKVVKVIPYGDNDKKLLSDEKPFLIDSSAMRISDKLDRKIKKLCDIHDDIRYLAACTNKMFSIQMLLLIAYGFMAITARIYFMYCSLVGQAIPSVFRAAESTIASSIYLIYTSAKCLVVVLVSHNTKRMSQRTGIYLHKVANAVDEDHLYETINHLSLKLLNHSIRFCACGFFELDMSTLYAIAGAITSYIIILIQFNLAALRGRKPNESSWGNLTFTLVNESSLQN